MRARRGFSLVELLVSLVMLGVVLGSLFGVVERTQRNAARQREAVRAQDNLRVADVFIRTVLRSALADPLLTGNGLLNPDFYGTGSFNNIRVRSDFNPVDGAFTGALEDVRIRVVSDTLKVQLTSSGAELPYLYPVRSLTFSYFDGNGNPITTTAGVASARQVRYRLTAPPPGISTDTIRRETWVYLRNRR